VPVVARQLQREDLVLGEEAENGGTPHSARPPITMQPNVNGIARRKPAIWSRFWLPAIAAITEPAP
jgi:hypothetical protein